MYSEIIFKQNDPNPDNIQGDINKGPIRSILSGFRRCMCKVIAPKKVAICYLDNNNSNLYHDGTPSKRDGSEGDVMVVIPDFYFSINRDMSGVITLRFSTQNVDGGYRYCEKSLVGAYKATESSGILWSRANSSPVKNISYSNIVGQGGLLGNRSEGFQLIDLNQHSIIALMLYAKYGTRHIRPVLGIGSADQNTNTGTSDMLGDNDTLAGSTGYVSALGVEGVYGGSYEFIDKVSKEEDSWVITDPDGHKFNVFAAKYSGTIKDTYLIASNSTLYCIPEDVDTNVSFDKHYTDYYYYSGQGQVLLRSYAGSSDYCGVMSLDTGALTTDANEYYSTRLAFRGEIQEINNVEEFKALPNNY